MKLYIYIVKIKQGNSWILSKTKLTNQKYITFIHVAERNLDGTMAIYYVYRNGNRSMITRKKITKPGWALQLSFFAHTKRRHYNTRIDIQMKPAPYRIKITMEPRMNGWKHCMHFYALNDLDYDKINIYKNKAAQKNTVPLISIAMGYFNRKEQLTFTLKTFEYSKIDNFEVVIADDASNERNDLRKLISKYNFPIKLIRITPEYKADKRYKNPCIVYNFAFDLCKGNKIIIQNPECCHIGDIINYVHRNCNFRNYLVFSCFTTDNLLQNKIIHRIYNGSDSSFNRILNKIGQIKEGAPPWYSHPKHRKTAYHFTSAITRKNLQELDGFSNSMAFGYWYDDNQLVYSIRRKGLVVKILPPKNKNQNLLSIHQWHTRFTNHRKDFNPLKNKNRNILRVFKAMHK